MANTLLILVILTNIQLLATNRMASLITLVAVQGMLLGVFALCARWAHIELGVLILGVAAIALKGFVFPWLLRRALKVVHAKRELQPFVGYVASLLIGVLALIFALWIGSRLHIPGKEISHLIVPATIFSVFSGLFLTISRKKAISQVVGFLVMENGVFMLGVGTLYYAPFLVEIGVLLDMLVAVLLMTLLITSMHRVFRHIDTHQLKRLKG